MIQNFITNELPIFTAIVITSLVSAIIGFIAGIKYLSNSNKYKLVSNEEHNSNGEITKQNITRSNSNDKIKLENKLNLLEDKYIYEDPTLPVIQIELNFYGYENNYIIVYYTSLLMYIKYKFIENLKEYVTNKLSLNELDLNNLKEIIQAEKPKLTSNIIISDNKQNLIDCYRELHGTTISISAYDFKFGRKRIYLLISSKYKVKFNVLYYKNLFDIISELEIVQLLHSIMKEIEKYKKSEIQFWHTIPGWEIDNFKINSNGEFCNKTQRNII